MKIGIIGGSGLYEIEGLTEVRETELDTPFGAPSDAFICGTLDGVELVFLARHSRGHTIMPSELNFRANICGMKQLGVERLVSFSAVGSLREDIAPRDFVLVDQFVDRTKRSADHTFFGDGIVGHISFADPVCGAMRDTLGPVVAEVLRAASSDPSARPPLMHKSGTYVNMQGPAFSTRAESFLYRSWGMDVIGMTNLAEAKLAREAEICYCTVAMVTDYDCWHSEHEEVSVEMIIQTLLENAAAAKTIIMNAVPKLVSAPACACSDALQHAVITPPDRFPPETRDKLAVLLDKYYPR
jgi:5'-methylthioadenosine phosphorylase